jgi:glycosyltransferase involved in cell wall biosynthesis/tetratricopeptide (TPR) repeat protein
VTDPADPPLLAVVVLSVGAAPELVGAVNSVLDQGIAVELVVVNSGGGDVGALLPAAAEQGIRIVSSPDLLWPGAARNRGIEATRARFVAFLAADCRAEPGWVAARLHHHARGAAAVASAIVNDSPRSAVATAYHLVHTASRDVNVAPSRAHRYGASYARWVFDRYGLFREDLRVAEDTEFHQRFSEDRPVWAPEIRTVHRNSSHLLRALRQHYSRGYNYGFYWAERPHQPFMVRTRKRVAKAQRDLDETIPRPHPAGRSWLGMVIWLSVLANQLGRTLGRRRARPAARLEAWARVHARAGHWQNAARKWGEVAALTGDALGPLRGYAAALARAGDRAGALDVHRRLVTLYADDCSLHVGRAYALVAAGSPADALKAWHSAAARFGRRPAIVEGLALTHLALGNGSDSEQHFAELTDLLPERQAGEWGLAEAALARQDWEAALSHLRTLGQRHGDPAALARAATICAYLGRPQDADAFLELLGSMEGASALHVEALIGALSARNNWEAIGGVLQRYRNEVLGGPALAPTVDALNMAGQSALALQLIAAADTPQNHHHGLRLATHLHVGETATALKVFEQSPKVNALSISSFTSLAIAIYEASGPAASAALVEKASRPRNRDALRFAAMFQSCRLESLAALERELPSLETGEEQCEKRLAELISGLPERPDGQASVALLQDYCSVFARLRATRADFAPDPTFVAADAVKVAAAIASAVRERRAFSLVRLGDGEGNMLPYREPYEGFRPTDYAATQRVWWGTANDPAGDLEPQLRAAIDNADVTGIPDLFRLSYVTSFSVLQGATGRSRNVRGLVAAFDYGARLRKGLLTSCHIHQALGHWGMWDFLLPQLGSVSLVTCHEALGPALAGQYGVEVVETFLVPPEAKHAAKFATATTGRHYPDVFDQLREPLGRVAEGHVVLVAAGALGKIYCNWIKCAGGIALDVGSAADHWCGYNTRPAHESLAYRTPPGVHARLEELAKTDPLVASIVHLRG